MDKHTAIASGLAFELQAEIKIAIGLLGGQIAIFIGSAFAEDGALLDDPLFVPIFFPAGQILPVKKRNPPTARRRLGFHADAQQQCGYEKNETSFNGKASLSA